MLLWRISRENAWMSSAERKCVHLRPLLCSRMSYDLPHFSMTSSRNSCPEMLGLSNILCSNKRFKRSPAVATGHHTLCDMERAYR